MKIRMLVALSLFGAVSLLTAAPTLAARQPTAPDPCAGAQSRGFPAVGFNRQVASKSRVNWEYRLSDSTGGCQIAAWTAPWAARVNDVSFRYDNAGGVGIGTIGATFDIVAATFSVGFDSGGKPAISAGPLQTLLTRSALASLAVPAAPMLNGWVLSYMFSKGASPSGAYLLISSSGTNAAGAWIEVNWRCGLTLPQVNPGSCEVVYFAPEDGFGPSVSWAATDGTLHITGSGPASDPPGTGAFYRLDLATNTLTPVFRLRSQLVGSRAVLVGSKTRVVVNERSSTSLCSSRNLVFDVEDCANGSCTVLNGAGHLGEATTAWSRDGSRVYQGGITQKSSGCSLSNAVEAFDALDTNGVRTPISIGTYPDGPGGG